MLFDLNPEKMQQTSWMPVNNSHDRNLTPSNFALPPDETVFGCTPAMRRMRQQLERICHANVPLLIQGAGGSGKETLARWVHHHSSWSSGPFIKINFAAIPGNLLESELFGHQAGAFTGANRSKVGRVELAQGGTLFLDQITDLDLPLQAKLLQLLQDSCFVRLGDHEERRVDARVICASTLRVEDAMLAGRFREDLYYRINVFRVELPPMSARREDIPAIADYLLKQCCLRFQREASAFEARELQLLQCREWPGNIREIENWVARYVLLGSEGLRAEQTTRKNGDTAITRMAGDGSIPLKRIVQQARRTVSHEVILEVLHANRWNRRRAAKDLKISYRKLLYEMRQIGLPPRRLQETTPKLADKSNIQAPSTD